MFVFSHHPLLYIFFLLIPIKLKIDYFFIFIIIIIHSSSFPNKWFKQRNIIKSTNLHYDPYLT